VVKFVLIPLLQVVTEPPYCHSNPEPIWGRIYFRACKKEILRSADPSASSE